jgi:hypothetical protein
MVIIDRVLDSVPAIGVMIALIYYTLTIRNQNRTREAQLLMNLYETYRSPEFRKRQMIIHNLEYSDFDDFWLKYGGETNPEFWAEWFSVAAYFNGIGVLVKRGLVDINLVEGLLSNIIWRSWTNMGGTILGWRKVIAPSRDRKYDLLHGFEYLYNELVKRDPNLSAEPNP